MEDHYAEMEDYYAKHRDKIEQELSDAVDEAIYAYAEDPLLHVAETLLRARKQKPTPTQLDFKSAVKMAMEKESRRRPTKDEVEKMDGSIKMWRAKKWLESLDLIQIIADGLLEPLKHESVDLQLELPYFEALGQHSSPHPIITSLNKNLHKIGDKIYNAATRLTKCADDAGKHPQTTWTSKFFESTDNEASGKLEPLRLGKTAHFFQGLDGFLGPPNPNLRESMVYEHCESADSQSPFRVHNYHTVTTPEIEWHFVVDPSKTVLDDLNLKEWPQEQQLVAPPTPRTSSMSSSDVDADKQKRKKPSPRQARDIKEFESELAEHNGKLRDRGHQPLRDEEFFAARLYTGPVRRAACPPPDALVPVAVPVHGPSPATARGRAPVHRHLAVPLLSRCHLHLRLPLSPPDDRCL